MSSTRNATLISAAARAVAAGVLIVCASRAAAAQDPLSHAKAVTKKAVAAEDAHIEAEQHPEAGQKPAAKPTSAPSSNASSAATPASAAKKPAPRDTVVPAVIMREAFQYDRAGRRDPFVSLLTTNELRPTLTDLKLTGIIYDRSPAHNSVATLRDGSANKTYSVHSGTTLGRMRVTAIKPLSVVFTIDEFGMTRQDSLVLRDPTKARER